MDVSGPPRNARFDTTSWSLVLTAAATGAPDAPAALGELCSRYWHPVYAFIRRNGYSREEAEDLTQGFFARLLAKDGLRHADRERGRFRSFLLTAVRNFIANAREAGLTQKRGGDRIHLPLDFEAAEESFRHDAPADPERLFVRRWALSVLDAALAEVRHESGEQFDLLAPFLTGDAARGDYETVAAKLGMSPGAVRVAVHRLRTRFREHLRGLVGQTLPDGDGVDDEIRSLIEAVSC